MGTTQRSGWRPCFPSQPKPKSMPSSPFHCRGQIQRGWINTRSVCRDPWVVKDVRGSEMETFRIIGNVTRETIEERGHGSTPMLTVGRAWTWPIHGTGGLKRACEIAR